MPLVADHLFQASRGTVPRKGGAGTVRSGGMDAPSRPSVAQYPTLGSGGAPQTRVLGSAQPTPARQPPPVHTDRGLAFCIYGVPPYEQGMKFADTTQGIARVGPPRRPHVRTDYPRPPLTRPDHRPDRLLAPAVTRPEYPIGG